MHHSGYYNFVSLIFGTTIPTSFNEMFFTLVYKHVYTMLCIYTFKAGYVYVFGNYIGNGPPHIVTLPLTMHPLL